VLIVDEDEGAAITLRDHARALRFEAASVSSGQAALDYLRTHPADVVVTDIGMSPMSGLELCHELHDHYPELLPIVITGDLALESAVDAIRAGAYDFLTKPVAVPALAVAIDRANAHLSLQRELARLRSTAGRRDPLDRIGGTSRLIRQMLELLCRVADSEVTVLITGESGTGKELVARALHARSSRRDQPFVAVNCAAVPAPLLESELFGHVRGAFTDAKEPRAGLFAQAGAGTIFLDEIGEMPIQMQVKLLRVLQEHEVRPVGSDEDLPFKARVISSTNRNLETEVREKRFREDLYYRVNVVAIPVPALRDRTGDVLILAQRFLTQIAARTNKPVRGFSEGVARQLEAYDWPGNVRELENCMERAVALCRLDEITIDDLPAALASHRTRVQEAIVVKPAEMLTLEEMDLRHIRETLAACGGNKTHAARVLGLDRRSLYRRLTERERCAAPA
jgi:two-component system response regulator HydG